MDGGPARRGILGETRGKRRPLLARRHPDIALPRHGAPLGAGPPASCAKALERRGGPIRGRM
eukprot:8619748-Lingulodinium_polyedra.AAC.1